MDHSCEGLTHALHELVAALPRFDHRFARSDLPANGIYFFFELDESVQIDTRATDRIVRVGTHRGDGRLPKRLRQHFAGNRRGSVFRMHLGGSLMSRDNPNDPRLATWIGARGVRI